jgi:hypothetical protein
MTTDIAYQPFVEWCFHQYTSPEEGKALLVVVTKTQEKSFKALMGKVRSVEVPAFSKKY